MEERISGIAVFRTRLEFKRKKLEGDLIVFQNHHRHSTYTNVKIADSIVSNEDYARRAVELGHGIISSCEHGYQGRYIEASRFAKKYGLKFLMSAEAHWVWDRTSTDRSNCHIWLGAKNENGREWINEVLSQANETGFYGQPRLDPQLIDLLPAGDVWITTACVAGWKYRVTDEDRLLDFYQHLYEKHGENFMFEVQYHNTPSQKELNQYILNLRSRIPAPIVMGCDSHYIQADGGQDRTDFLNSKEIYYEDEQGWYLDYPDGTEAVRRFQEQGVLSESQILEAVDRTNVFLTVEEYTCDIFDDSVKLFSLHPDWTQQQKDAEYERLVWKGWEQDKPIVEQSRIPEYLHEIRSEIDIVKQCGMADYFIDNYHIIRRGKELGGHLTSTGRGSAVSFYTNKLLGFTSVDRIAAKVHMYKERFMTAERILETKSLPDIDFNVAEQDIFAQGQSDVCGRDHAVQMIAYGTQKASAAWKMFAKSQGVDFQTANEVSSQIKRYEDKLKHVAEDEKDDVNILDFIDKRFHEIYQKSTDYQGIIVSWSPAPCAFLLYQGSIRRKIGLVRIKDKICCLMDGHWAEENHFLKNDLLRVAVVDLISKGYARAGIPVPSVNELLKMSPPEDPCWDIYRRGCTIGINQVEQPGTSSRVGVYAPQNISELCAFVAAIRPGFKSMYKTFESRQDFSYNVSAFDNILRTEEMPQSFCLYQEQQMAALNFAGFPMSECYAAIKNIAKKRAEKVLAYKERFIAGFSDALIREEDISEAEADDKSRMVWQILEDSARYSFNACVSGRTRIYRSSFREDQFAPTIEEMFNIKNDPEYAKRTGHFSLHKKYAAHGYGKSLSLCDDGRLRENAIVDISYAGVREVYRITVSDHQQIICTSNHKFPTPNGEKRTDALKTFNLLYIIDSSNKQVVAVPILSIEKVGVEPVYDVEMESPYHNFVLDNGIVTSNSHSYCVSLDSLYGAWLKAHYPIEFYETYMKIQSASGDKDKLAAAKQEAENYFQVKFPPFKYGQDNRDILGEPGANSISSSLSAIKGFGFSVSDSIYKVSSEVHSNYLSDILVALDAVGVKESKTRPLAKIGFFSSFGNDAEVLRIMDVLLLFKYGEAKKIVKDKVDGTWLSEIVSQNAIGITKAGTPAKSYTITNLPNILHLAEEKILSAKIPDLPVKTKIQNHLDILGYVDLTTGKEEDIRTIFVLNIRPLITNEKHWGYAVYAKSLGSGKTARLTCKINVFEKNPFEENDILSIPYKGDLSRNNHGYWYLNRYDRVI